MEKIYAYPVSLELGEEGDVNVTFPDLPEALTCGADTAEALELAADCLAEALAGRINDNEEIPRPSAVAPGQVNISCPPQLALKAAVYELLRAQGISKVKLAELLGVNEKEARRITDPRHNTRLATLVQTLRVLGKQVQVSIEDLPEAV